MSDRGKWSGSYGFTLAAIGSAVGLGNMWRFPYLAGVNGGGAFVLLYLVMAIIFGISLLLAEQALGRYAGKNAYGAFRLIHKRFSFAGSIAILANFLILSFYGMIGGWVLYYLITSIAAPGAQTPEGFQSFSSSVFTSIFSLLGFMMLTAMLIWRGVSKGIEWSNRFMMPALFIILILMVIRSLTLPGAMDGVYFFFQPNFSKITGTTVIAALGQVFFSMSVGFGIMLTYASYLGKETSLITTSWVVALTNSGVAILSGLAIMPAVFAFKMEPTQGPGLLFVVIPEVFKQMPGGYFFGILFFLLVFFAALSSSISILEVPVSYMVDERGYSRKKAVVISTSICASLGILCSLSMGKTLGWFKICGMGIFDILDFISNSILLPIGGLMICIVVGYVWGPRRAHAEITQNGPQLFTGEKCWIIMIRYIAPLAIIAILVSGSGIQEFILSLFN